MSRQYSDIIASLGFPPLMGVRDRFSLADRFPASRRRCGLYLLEFEKSLFYIGQALDVVRRFGQHRRDHPDIVGFSFLPLRATELDASERSAIWQAEQLGLPITNRVHVVDVIGDTDFDLLMPESDQERWVEKPQSFIRTELSNRRNMIGGQQEARYQQKFEKFMQLVDSALVINTLQGFIRNCVPAFRRSEGSFWSLSCLPSTGGKAWGRLAVVNLRSTEVLVLGRIGGEEDLTWAFVNVAESAMKEAFGTRRGMKAAFPDVHFKRVLYPSAGPDMLQLWAGSIEALGDALEDSNVQRAARITTLRLARKGATIYSKFHCPQLASHVV